MADEIPEQIRPEEESKKDTVRINLPPGITGRGGPPGPTPPPGATIRPSSPPVNPQEEAKKETAVMGRPAEAPKPKKDTSRVQVAAAKPIAADARPAVKLRREDEAPAPAAVATATAKASAPARSVPAMAGAPSGADVGLSLVALVLSLVVAGYLAFVAFG